MKTKVTAKVTTKWASPLVPAQKDGRVLSSAHLAKLKAAHAEIGDVIGRHEDSMAARVPPGEGGAPAVEKRGLEHVTSEDIQGAIARALAGGRA